MLNTMDSLNSRWSHWIDPQWIEALDETEFLSRCREGRAGVRELHTFLVQQYFYARHFTRFLCALLSNVENESDRRELTENLVDEIGLGKADGVPHSILYRNMLGAMGVDVSRHQPLPETQALIDTMFESCRNPSVAAGLGALCLGAEAIVPHLYQQIVTGFLARGEKSERLEFFHIHIACDDAHADTMRALIERRYGQADGARTLKCSAARAIASRIRFFNAISAASTPWKEVRHAHV